MRVDIPMEKGTQGTSFSSFSWFSIFGEAAPTWSRFFLFGIFGRASGQKNSTKNTENIICLFFYIGIPIGNGLFFVMWVWAASCWADASIALLLHNKLALLSIPQGPEQFLDPVCRPRHFFYNKELLFLWYDFLLRVGRLRCPPPPTHFWTLQYRKVSFLANGGSRYPHLWWGHEMMIVLLSQFPCTLNLVYQLSHSQTQSFRHSLALILR